MVEDGSSSRFAFIPQTCFYIGRSLLRPVSKLVLDLRRFSIIDAMFLNDKEVARLIGLSPSWVRGQRYKRSHGLPHILDLQPRYIGCCPRYVRGEVDAFLAALAA
jgi:hypothetical protein